VEKRRSIWSDYDDSEAPVDLVVGRDIGQSRPQAAPALRRTIIGTRKQVARNRSAMSEGFMQAHGGRLAAKTLREAGVDCVFTLCGGHVMPIYDGCLTRASE